MQQVAPHPQRLDLRELPVQAQREATAALTELGMAHAVAPSTCGGLMRPDLIVVRGAERVAISLDAADRFSVNAPHRPMGEAILGWRLLVLQQFQVWPGLPCATLRIHAASMSVQCAWLACSAMAC